MADQASLKAAGNGTRTNGSAESMVGGIAEFGNDVATLAELQAKLAMYDLKECVEDVAKPVLATAVGLALALASLPVILAGVGLMLAAALHVSEGLALLLTGAVVLATSGALAFVASRRMFAGLANFQRSREELVRNLSWIRTVLVHSGRTLSSRRS